MSSSKKKVSHIKRREFMKKSLLASSVFIVPPKVLGGTRYTAPSDQLNLAAIGAGGKGTSDIWHAWNDGSERVVALCDVHPDGQHGVVASRENFPDANFYEDFRVMFDNETDIDAVTITTPDHTHANAAIWAMERNKHVYVQKPLTHNIKEARKLTLMARENQLVTQMGNQGASNPDQLVIQRWVKEGQIGKISKVYVWTNRPVWPQGYAMAEQDPSQKPENLQWDLWLGPAKSVAYTPKLHPFNWRGWWEYGTGALGDMGCHIIDVPFRALQLKYPTNVECSVGTVYTRMWSAEYHPEGCPASSMVTLSFEATEVNDSPIKMIWMDGGIKPAHPDLLPDEAEIGPNGVLLVGEKGTIMSDVYGINPQLFKSGEPIQVVEKTDDPRYDLPEYGHQKSWTKACKAGFNSPEHQALTSSFDFAGPLTEAVLMGNIAIRSYNLRKEIEGQAPEYYGRKKLLWDGENMRITNFEEANQFVGRDYRYSWAIK
ncbi:MAG: Gfo/Idh/MocA family oxidoreductase [Flavobacteriaceae bacterium]|nr:Gfo/Idh/MocA family oxidoreductase [Flavobacteriaceae bacterium]